MDWTGWYTDTVDVYRTVQTASGALLRQSREQVGCGFACRVYEDSAKPPVMTGQAAEIKQTSKLACANEVDIRAGDELIIHRGGAPGVGRAAFAVRAFAGEPHYHFEPFGAVIPGLAHQEIVLLQQERIT